MFAGFDTLSLDALNVRAPLMLRRDSKYLVSGDQLKLFLVSIVADYDLLEIDGIRQFDYHTHYLDTPDLKCFQDHNKGRRRRLKLRFRHYVDSGLYYLELKVKGERNLTQKYRRRINASTYENGVLTPGLLDFVNQKLLIHYQQSLADGFNKKLWVKYRRVTLVSKTGIERITFDNGLTFGDGSQSVEADPQLWVVEVKSKHGHTSIDKHLFKQQSRPVPNCSKYCVGMSLMQKSYRANRFTSVVKRFLRPR